MFRNVFQPAGFITLLSSSGSQPAQIWSREGSLTRVMDDVLCYPVLELDDQAVSIKQVLRFAQPRPACVMCNPSSSRCVPSPLRSSNYIVSPANPESTLGIRLPHLLLTLRPVRALRWSDGLSDCLVSPLLPLLAGPHLHPLQLSERFFMIQVTVQDKFGRILRLIFSNFCVSCRVSRGLAKADLG